MYLTNIIIILSLIAWVFPPFRQYKSPFFVYFLLLAVADPFYLLLYECKLSFVPFKIIFHTLFLLSLIDFKDIKKILYVIIPVTVISFLSYKFMVRNEITIIFAVIHTGIIFILLQRLSKRIVLPDIEFNVFLMLLIFYESTLVTKFFISVVNIQKGMYYLYFTSAFEIFFAAAFSFIREDNKTFVIRIKK